jgi:hypothetical protein
MSDRLIRHLRAQRMSWIDLGDGKGVRIIRPTEVEIGKNLFNEGRVEVDFETMSKFVRDWRGFTEADILGAGVGSDDVVPFTSDLWEEIASDKIEWVRTVANAILQSAVDHQQRKDDAQKNS